MSSYLARELGVSSSAMARMDNEGVLQRVVPGVYIGAGQAQETLIEPAAWVVRHPHAVACLLTAAVYHDLTDAFARGTWLYVPKDRGTARCGRNIEGQLGNAAHRVGAGRLRYFAGVVSASGGAPSEHLAVRLVRPRASRHQPVARTR